MSRFGLVKNSTIIFDAANPCVLYILINNINVKSSSLLYTFTYSSIGQENALTKWT